MRCYPPPLLSLLFTVLIFTSIAKGQDQLGINLNTAEAMPSYTLYEAMPMVYLVDNCGQLVHSWNTGFMSFHPKLMPNGNLVFIANRFTVREVDWDGNIVNEVSHEDLELSIEYEVVILPNGNYLCVARRDFLQEEFIALGFDWSGFSSPDVTDGVVELDRETGDIVWEWNTRDHVIQERDPDANNYGLLSEHPELLNMDAISTYDWQFHESFMINSMDYNPELDQIAVSVRKMSEVAIIDHSTTTEEAAGHTGGNSGKGGDILYRWGNPQNYGRGDADDRQLFFQHNPNWITHGPNAGRLIVYDNGLNRPFDPDSPEPFYSTVPVLNLPVDENGNYTIADEEPFGPVAPFVRFSALETNTQFYSSYTSGAELLPNGNIFITEGVVGRLMEVNPAGEVVWNFRVPFTSYIYRTEKYPLDYPAFAGRDLIPVGPAPNSNSTYDCSLISSTEEIAEAGRVTANYYPAEQLIRLENAAGNGMSWNLYDTHGRLLSSGQSDFSRAEVSALALPAGLYVIQVQDVLTRQQSAKKVVKFY